MNNLEYCCPNCGIVKTIMQSKPEPEILRCGICKCPVLEVGTHPAIYESIKNNYNAYEKNRSELEELTRKYDEALSTIQRYEFSMRKMSKRDLKRRKLIKLMSKELSELL